MNWMDDPASKALMEFAKARGPGGAICKYSQSWNCQEPAVLDGMCMPHSALFYWMVHGPGETETRLAEHDAVAGLGASALTELLHGPVWAPRMREVLGIREVLGLPAAEADRRRGEDGGA